MAFVMRALYFLCLFLLTQANILTEEECLNFTVYPLNYELNIYPYIHRDNSYYDCDMTITVMANAPVQTIYLEATDLKIVGDIKVLDGERDIINGARPFEYTPGKLVIFLREPLKIYTSSHKKYYIKISFKKDVKEDGNGVFLVKYYDEQSQAFKYLFTTRLSPNNAKYFFPCFHNLMFEAGFKFKVYILQRETSVQYTNTALVIAQEQQTTNIRNDYVIIDFMPSPQVRLYQVGFHYSTFASNKATSKTTNDTLVVWAPADELKHLHFILFYGITIIDIIHEYEKVKNPLVHGPINLVAVPATRLNGYEIGSWNLLTNGAHRIANMEQFTCIKQIETMTFELTQQLSRIWLGNPGQVKPTIWKVEWFKEGLATYLAYYFLTQYNYGIQSAHKLALGSYGLQMKHKAMSIDWDGSTPALETFNTTLAVEISPRYKELVTMKTGAILWMLENWVGSDKFHQVLVNYINSSKGITIDLKHFMKTLDQETEFCLHKYFNGSTASMILKSWFGRSGYPVINVQVLRDRNLNAIQLKQRRFSFTHEHREDTDYLIPISYIVQHNQNCFNCHRPRFTIGAQSYTFKENLNDGWIILNRNGSGYYRVNYDAVTWRLIAKTLKENMLSIDELNRAQIVNDVLALYVAGDVQLSIAMAVLDYLDMERSPTVWEAVISGFELFTIKGAAYNMTKNLYYDWQDLMKKKITLMYTKLVTIGDQCLKTRSFRSNIVEFACSLNYEHCQKYVRKMYLDNKRGAHNMFPDCRKSYFYMLNTSDNLVSYNTKLNVIEHEDKQLAERKKWEQNMFLMKLPIGERRPMEYIQIIPTTETPTVAVSDKQIAHGGSTLNKFSLLVLSTAMLMNIIITD